MDTQQTIAHLWKRIGNWYAANTPAGYFELRPGAAEQEIVALENHLQVFHFPEEPLAHWIRNASGQPPLEEVLCVRLPEDVRASYALHNGTTQNSWLLDGGHLLSLAEIAKKWGWMKDNMDMIDLNWCPDLEGPITPVFWSVRRIPLTDNSGDHIILDLDPPPEGTYGQILDFSHEVGPIKVLAFNYSEWLRGFAERLESGDYAFIEKAGQVVPIAKFRNS